MKSQHDLARAFDRGASTGQASNVSIQETPNGGAVLVGYGHAVYAYRSPGGHITTYMGWYDRNNIRSHAGSQSTKCQYGTMGLQAKADTVIEGTDTNAAPKVVGFEPPS